MSEPESVQPAPARTWRELPGWRGLPTAAWLLGVGLIAQAVVTAIQRGLFTYQFSRLRDSEGDSEAIFEALELYNKLFPVIDIFVGGVVLLGVIQLARAPRDTGARVFGMIAAVCVGLLYVSATAVTIEWLVAEQHELGDWLYRGSVRYALPLLDAATWIAVLLALMRLATAVRSPLGFLAPLVGPCIVWIAGFQLYRMSGSSPGMLGDSPWTYLMLTLAPWVIVAGGLGYAAIRVARAMNSYATDGAAPAPTGSAGPLHSPLWSECAGGLELYATALSWRLGVAVGGYAMLMMAIFGKSIAMARMMGWMLPLAALITAFVMLRGLYLYARQPEECPAGAGAWIAFVTMLIAVALDAYAFMLVLELMTVDPTDWSAVSDARSAAESAQSLSMWGMSIGFMSLLVLLVSFRQMAHHIAHRDLARRVVSTGIAIALAASAVLGVRSMVDRTMEVGEVVMLAIGALGLAVFAVLSYIRLVRALAEAIRDSTGEVGLPAARVIDSAD